MDVRPVRRYGFPAYPSRLAVLAEPDLLRQHMPLAWRKCAEMVGAAALLAFGGPLGCDSGPAAVVAPLFHHGEGRGSIGCIVVAPPVFLSEEEALQIIKDGLAPNGIVLSTNATKPDDLDGVDLTRKVAVEFVSSADYLDFGGARPKGSVQSYDFKGVASNLPQRLKRQAGGMYLGVFYDPVAKINSSLKLDPRNRKEWDSAWSGEQQRAGAEATQLLREQVKDFADWLKAQGAI